MRFERVHLNERVVGADPVVTASAVAKSIERDMTVPMRATRVRTRYDERRCSAWLVGFRASRRWRRLPQCAPSHAEPPAEREAGTPAETAVQTFAVDSIVLGDVVHLGDAPTLDAWKSLGYDLDGLVTDSTSTNVCTLFDGAA